MKVLCIVNEPWDVGGGPIYGDVDVVINELNRSDVRYYELERFKGRAFQSDIFVPIDYDLDETELVTEEFEEKYFVPVKNNVCKSYV